MSEKVKIAILGASGYTGAELVRLLWTHPRADLRVLTADRRAGQPLGAVFPQFAGLDLPDLVALDAVDWSAVDFVFCALPHGTTQEVVAGLPGHLKVCDLSADFRLYNPAVYAEWYGQSHRAVQLQKSVVYGLTEINRDQVAQARVVANPGCYPTAAQIPLAPLLKAGLIAAEDIVIDAKSGVTGAGRAARETSLYAEVTEGVHAYGVAGHRHCPEIEQGLSEAAGRELRVTFTPHLMPMARGMLASIYVKLAAGRTAADLRAELARVYADEPFVRLLDEGLAPQTRHVRGSNLCVLNVFADRVPGRAMIFAAIDNLTKGASGQAIQNMNVMLGLPETMGLDGLPVFP
jgi:N-acetyl-gamma-glutamyl-phosphate reductase